MRIFVLAMLAIGLAFQAAAADIGGKWTGKVEFKSADGTPNGGEAYAEFKQSGADITGVIGRNEMETVAIENGQLAGDKLTFQVTLPGDAKRIIKFSLVVVNATHIEGDAEGINESGDKMPGKVALDRKTS